MKFGIIGTGNMAEAIIAGLISKKVFKASQLVGFDVNAARVQQMQKKYGIQAADTLQELAKKADVLLLSVKPQHMQEVCTALSPWLANRHLILSIAAGLPVSFYQKHLGQTGRLRLVRLMPNTPALIGLGATAFFMNSVCKNTDRKIVQRIFSATGIVVEVKREKLLDAVTAVSGSGPAYVYLFIHALIQAGVKSGLSENVARTLAEQTAIGAAELLKRSGENPADLIAKVASKGGTTEAGLKVLKQKGFESIIAQTVKAAALRAQQLKK